MKIKVSYIRNLIIAHVFLALLFMFGMSELNLSWGITYFLDLLLIIETCFAIVQYRRSSKQAGLNKDIVYFIIFAMLMIVSNILGGFSAKNLMLGFRRIFRFNLFFFNCSVLLEKEDIDRFFKYLDYMFYINFVISIYQYFILHLYGDHLGGIFGTQTGSNAYTNVFLCVICIYYICKYLDKKVSVKRLLLFLIISVVISAMAELKIFFLEIAVIAAFSVMLFKPNKRTFKMVFLFSAVLILGILLFIKIFPEQAILLYDKKAILDYTTKENYGYNIGRLSAFKDINKLFFHNDISLNLFGFGFGNCEAGTDFFARFSKLHYTWFTHQVTFLETGFIGTAVYMFFFVYVFMSIQKKKKMYKTEQPYFVLVQVICIISFIWYVYNQCLRIEVAYFIFMLLAIPNILYKNKELV